MGSCFALRFFVCLASCEFNTKHKTKQQKNCTREKVIIWLTYKPGLALTASEQSSPVFNKFSKFR